MLYHAYDFQRAMFAGASRWAEATARALETMPAPFATVTQAPVVASALDVFAQEPLDAAQGALFAGVPNLLLTPHIAGVTDESNVRVSRVTLEAVLRHLSG